VAAYGFVRFGQPVHGALDRRHDVGDRNGAGRELTECPVDDTRQDEAQILCEALVAVAQHGPGRRYDDVEPMLCESVTARAGLGAHIGLQGGSLVNISSSAGIKGTPLHTPYTAAKHGVVGMSLALANELAAQSARVNTVHPTGVPTGMAPPSMHQLIAEQRPDLAALFMNALPVLMTEAIDVSNAVLFLVSDEARYVTGLQFTVDAGVTIR